MSNKAKPQPKPKPPPGFTLKEVEMTILRLEPGDILLVQCPTDCTDEMLGLVAGAVQYVLDKCGPKGVMQLGGHNNIQFSVIRKSAGGNA